MGHESWISSQYLEVQGQKSAGAYPLVKHPGIINCTKKGELSTLHTSIHCSKVNGTNNMQCMLIFSVYTVMNPLSLKEKSNHEKNIVWTCYFYMKTQIEIQNKQFLENHLLLELELSTSGMMSRSWNCNDLPKMHYLTRVKWR